MQGVEPVTPALVGVVIGLEKVDGVLSTLLDADESPELEVLPIPVPIVDVLVGEERLELDMPERLELKGWSSRDSSLIRGSFLQRCSKLPLTPDDEEDESPVDDVVDELGRVAESGGLALTDDTVDVKGELEELPIPPTEVPDDVPLPGMHGLGVVVDTGGLVMGGIGFV